MNTWTLRLGLSLIVVVGFWTNRLPAQEVLVVPEIPYAPDYQPPSQFQFTRRPLPLPIPGDQRGHHGTPGHCVGCQDDPSYPLCSGLHYELRFMFGSCRTFFDQPCVPSRPVRHTPR